MTNNQRRPTWRRFDRAAAFGAALVLVVAVPVLVGTANAQEMFQAIVGTTNAEEILQTTGPTTESVVDPFVGSYSQTIPILVPLFHGIEPRLSLHYNSSGRNGIVGVGWELTGFSVIERASNGRGAPRYDSTDIYLLDHQELVPCQKGSVSPSCTTGGTHSTRIESYLRIQKDEASNRWHVWRKDGTQLTYVWLDIRVKGTTFFTFRWGLWRVVDTHGNTVTYNWGTGDDLYPLWVSYNGTMVTFYRETRTDIISFATGGNTLGLTVDRLKTIDVCVKTPATEGPCRTDGTPDPARARAYRLAYDPPSPNTGRSLLASVQMFGKDATLDASGTVTGGTASPVTRFAYDDRPSRDYDQVPRTSSGVGYTSGTDNCLYVTLQPPIGTIPCRAGYFVSGDINGDGKPDLVHFIDENVFTWLSHGDGTFAVVSIPRGDLTGCKVFAADPTGDGKTDLVYVCAGEIRIWRSNGDGTYSALSPASDRDDTCTMIPDCGRWQTGDVDGDGKTDLIHFTNNPGNLITWLSNGDGTFRTVRDTSGADTCLLECGAWAVGDVNGDGRADLIHGTDNPGNFITWLSNGDGTYDVVSYISRDDTCMGCGTWSFGDVNGDGNTDLLHITNGPGLVITWLSNGDGTYTVERYSSTADTCLADPDCGGGSWFLVGDVNGDGRADLLHITRNPGNVISWLSNGDGTYHVVSYTSRDDTCLVECGVWTVGDVNGDGKTDLIHITTNPGQIITWLARGSYGDLLTWTSNGFGGATRVRYTPSSAWENANNPPIMQTVTSLTSTDGRGVDARTTYTYAGGFYDHLDRRFLGFRYAKKVLPCLVTERRCPYEETWFRQDIASAAKPERILFSDGSGRALRQTDYVYTTNGSTIPYTSLETERWQLSYGTSGSVRRFALELETERWQLSYGTSGSVRRFALERCLSRVADGTCQTPAFDAYGNMTQEINHGDASLIGDEKTTQYDYRYNTDAYIVEKPSAIEIFAGAGTAGPRISETRYCYDGAGHACWEIAPVKGDLTLVAEWLNTTDSFVSTQAEYDSYGNVTGVIGPPTPAAPTGARTEYHYDATYRGFVVEVRDPLYFPPTNDLLHKITVPRLDAQCGKPTTIRGLNLLDTTLTYDSLCRLVRIVRPGGAFWNRAYVNVGDPWRQYVQVEIPGMSAAGCIGVKECVWERSYSDGFGRSWRKENKGPEVGREIVEETQYDARGNVLRKTAPYYSTGLYYATPQWTDVWYDSLDRVVRIIHSDGGFVTRSYDPWSVTIIDELGHQRREEFDAYGRVTRRSEGPTRFIDGMPSYEVGYEFDLLGNVRHITDPAGNAWSFIFDSLGRMTRMIDPDLGTWDYEYDAAGNETAHYDNMSPRQRTEFTRDAIGRTVTKTTRAGTPEAATVRYTYDQNRPGHYNRGKLTSLTDETSGNMVLYDYDRAGNLVRRTHYVDGLAYTFQYAYDVGGRLLGTKYPDGDVIGIDPITRAGAPLVYDASGRLRTIPGIILEARYTPLGQVRIQSNANGTWTERSFSLERGWLSGIQTDGAPYRICSSDGHCVTGRLRVQDHSYIRDAEGKVETISTSFANEGWSFGYDEMHRLTSATNASSAGYSQIFHYDNIGNVTYNSQLEGSAPNYTYPVSGPSGCGASMPCAQPHAVHTAGTNTYSYDQNGNMLTGAAWTITWDGDNRPVGVSGTTTVSLTYSPDGSRLKKIGTSETIYLGDDYEISSTGVATKYVALEGTLVAKRTGTTMFWLHTDDQGSIQAITDSTGGAVERRSYWAYGSGLFSAPATYQESRGYTGQRQDESGLLYLHARYYDPSLGRFVSPDPIVSGDRLVGLNRYAYAVNDPVNHTDVMGLQGSPCDVGVVSCATPLDPVELWSSTYEAYNQLASSVRRGTQLIVGSPPISSAGSEVVSPPRTTMREVRQRQPHVVEEDPFSDEHVRRVIDFALDFGREMAGCGSSTSPRPCREPVSVQLAYAFQWILRARREDPFGLGQDLNYAAAEHYLQNRYFVASGTGGLLPSPFAAVIWDINTGIYDFLKTLGYDSRETAAPPTPPDPRVNSWAHQGILDELYEWAFPEPP